MAVDSTLFIAIPTLALLLNLFLLLITLSAKQNRLVTGFMFLVLALSLWTGGSAGMRATLYPGARFWYKVSLTGIFLTPFLFYNFVHHYTGQKGWFTWAALALAWLVMLVLQWAGVFMQSPFVGVENGARSFSYEISPWIALPFLLVLLTLALGARLIIRAVRRQEARQGIELVFLGAVILLLGTLASAYLGARSFPVDPLACGINALLLFNALYRRRLITFKMVTGRGPVYLAAAVWTFLLLVLSYPALDRLYKQLFPEHPQQQTIAFAMLASLTTVLTYSVLRYLLARLFDKGNRQREEELRRLSLGINQSLDLPQILATFSEFIERNIECDAAYICVQDQAGDFVTRPGDKPSLSEPLTLRQDSPLITWLAAQGGAVSLKDFARTQHYRALWESEKAWLERLMIRFALPITEAGRLTAVALFADSDSRAGSPPATPCCWSRPARWSPSPPRTPCSTPPCRMRPTTTA